MRTPIACLALAMAACASLCDPAPRVTFQNNRLQVDGQPFFIYGCWGTPDDDLAAG